jgi:hypothetical protein
MIESSEEAQILSAGEPGVETEVGPSMITNLTAHRGRVANCIMTRYDNLTGGRKEQGGQDAQQRGFARAIGSEQGNRLAWTHVQGNAAERGHRWRQERL